MRFPLCLLVAIPLSAAAAGDGQGAAFFRDKVRPILSERCFKCHSHEADKIKGGLILDSREAMLTGGDTGPAIVPGDPEKSLLIKAIRYDDADLKMPPNKGGGKKLPDAAIATLTEWVKLGALWPEEPKGQKMTSRAKGAITDEDRKWWAIHPIAKPQPPKVADNGWAKNEIDRFVFQKLAAAGLKPAPSANPEQLCRRLYFDLIGLPPGPQETAQFVQAAAKNFQAAVSELTDKLLASPRYGERWARHWLDLVRYAESDGYKIDEYRPNAWRYRDYVVRAFNSDKPYDRFVQEQLAGDELWPADGDALTATGYLRAWIYEYNNRDVLGQWQSILNDITDVTADVFLGVGVQCARCHDHKFDPILQKDYYRLQAFFAGILPRDDLDAATPEQRAAFLEKQKPWDEKTAALRAQMAALENKTKEKLRREQVKKFPADIQTMINKTAAERAPLETQLGDLAFRQVTYEWDHLLTHIKGAEKEKLSRLRRDLTAFNGDKPEPLPAILTVTDVGPKAPAIRIPKKDSLGDIDPGFLTILEAAPAKVNAMPQSTGRRSALAKWITQPENPLTTRVIVNRVWQYHFGRGLVGTSSDFGKLGDPPSHPELLDWLARRFVADGWSFKKIHKLICTSATYQQSASVPLVRLRAAPSVANKEAAQVPAGRPKPPPQAANSPANMDPENRLLWHFGTRRLEAEQVRDAILSATGELELTDGGPSIGWDKPRRTIGTKVMRNTRDSLLEVFDAPEGFQSTAERNTTTTPTQALTLFNGPWLLARSKTLAARVQRESSADESELASAAMRLAWNREPSAAEIQKARAFLDAQGNQIEQRPGVARPVALATEKMPYREGMGVVLCSGGMDRLTVANSTSLPDGDFTIEAFVLLRSLYESGEVRTIASHSDSVKGHTGWSFGVTGMHSRDKPQTLVLLLHGKGKSDGIEEAVFSGLHLEVGKPCYVAVSVHFADTGPDGATFYVKDLSNDDLPMQISTVPHTTTPGTRSTADFLIGARGAAKTNVWDGLVDDVRLSRVALPAEQLLQNSGQTTNDSTVGFWRFETDDSMYKDSSASANDIQPAATNGKALDPRTSALVDFCHVLLNSNEFLYLD